MIASPARRAIGEGTVQYRLKDWGISRQRYWGTPIPMIYCERDGIVPVPDDQLPVELPRIAEFTGAAIRRSRRCPSSSTCVSEVRRPGRRETDTMDTFVDSSWYFYASPIPRNDLDAVRPGGGQVLAAGGLLQRRRRARHPAPDLLRASSRACSATSAWSITASRSRSSSRRGWC
jgi:leucyl-tRNA synthetase